MADSGSAHGGTTLEPIDEEGGTVAESALARGSASGSETEVQELGSGNVDEDDDLQGASVSHDASVEQVRAKGYLALNPPLRAVLQCSESSLTCTNPFRVFSCRCPPYMTS